MKSSVKNSRKEIVKIIIGNAKYGKLTWEPPPDLASSLSRPSKACSTAAEGFKEIGEHFKIPAPADEYEKKITGTMIPFFEMGCDRFLILMALIAKKVKDPGLIALYMDQVFAGIDKMEIDISEINE